MYSSFDPIKSLTSWLTLNICGTSLPCNFACLMCQHEGGKKHREVNYFLYNSISKINALIENTKLNH